MENSILNDFKNAWGKPENATIQLIIINVSVFAILRISGVFFFFSGVEGLVDTVIDFLGVPDSFQKLIFKPWTVVTYMFTHYSFFHILFNMLLLYWFGKIIEEYLGSKKLIGIYVWGGFFGAFLYILLYNLLPNFSNQIPSSTLIGASAGITALIVAAAFNTPNFTIYLLLFGPVKLKYFAAVSVFLSFIGTTGSNAGGAIAHLGGAVLGWFFISQIKHGNDLSIPVTNSIEWIRSLFVPSPKIKVSHRAKEKNNDNGNVKIKTGRKPKTGKVPQEEIDEILDKISQSGYDSLTKSEKQKLFEASKK